MSSSLEPKSRYTCVITNVSNSTPTRDIEKEADYSGKIRYLTRHADEREVLVEFDRSDDAKHFYNTAHGLKMDGRKWSVYMATPKDFKFHGWKWTEGGLEEPSRGRSRSRSPGFKKSPHSRRSSQSPGPKRDNY